MRTVHNPDGEMAFTPFKFGKDRPRFGSWLDLGVQAGATLAISVAALTYLGYLADGQFGTSPLFLIIGALWGAAGGTWWVVVKVKTFGDEQERRELEEKSTKEPGESPRG